MSNQIKQQAETKMQKAIESLEHAFNRIRTGRASVSILDGVRVMYYGNEVPISQVASVTVEDARTLSLTPWEKHLVGDIEKAILNADLGLNPVSAGQVIRVPMPALTEETRKNFIRKARGETETIRVSVRNIRRDANSDIKIALNAKEITEDDERRMHDDIQKLTDKYIAVIDQMLVQKEKDLMEI